MKLIDTDKMVDITQMGDFGSLVACMICDKPFEVRAYDHRIMCPSCKQGLKELLEARKRRAEGKRKNEHRQENP